MKDWPTPCSGLQAPGHPREGTSSVHTESLTRGEILKGATCGHILDWACTRIMTSIIAMFHCEHQRTGLREPLHRIVAVWGRNQHLTGEARIRVQNSGLSQKSLVVLLLFSRAVYGYPVSGGPSPPTQTKTGAPLSGPFQNVSLM